MPVTKQIWLFILLLCTSCLSCGRLRTSSEQSTHPVGSSQAATGTVYEAKIARGALLLTRYKSMNQLTSVIDIQYHKAIPAFGHMVFDRASAELTQQSGNQRVTCILSSGVSEDDFVRARDGNFWDRVRLALISPYALFHKNDLWRVEILGRRRPNMFGEGDVAFYDLAEAMVYHISDEDMMYMPTEDLSEKGYLNTFNHVTAQALMTSIFSEGLADFVADVHERHTLPALVTGDFTRDELEDREGGPLDNYLDLINNEWGQELGKQLRVEYQISEDTYWTPELLANFLNDIQDYYSRTFDIGFTPFRPTDEMVVRFARKINLVRQHVSELSSYY